MQPCLERSNPGTLQRGLGLCINVSGQLNYSAGSPYLGDGRDQLQQSREGRTTMEAGGTMSDASELRGVRDDVSKISASDALTQCLNCDFGLVEAEWNIISHTV